MKRTFLLIILIVMLPAVVLAEATNIYAVQVGSYKTFAEDAKQIVSKFGEVHVFTFKNLSRVTVGEFKNRQSAADLLSKLKEAGFKDAFVRQVGYTDLAQAKSTIEKFNVLISEMDAQAFYLDGSMYLFQGQGYIKIHRYE